MRSHQADITESILRSLSDNALGLLLKDHTTQRPIFWATDSYAQRGAGFQFFDPITPNHILGEQDNAVIRPRAFKTKEQQKGRTRGMAEVFTPAWVCNMQNNLIDEDWFGRTGVFNIEDTEHHTWIATTEPIQFPEGKTWKDYVRSTRMEITCGEGPYLASRYDTPTGTFIPVGQRIGILDRKLRIVSENTTEPAKWLTMAYRALQNTLGYEWQGDSLLLARIAILITFVEYYMLRFGKEPPMASKEQALYYISWNLWQMDGLRGVIPNSCHDEVKVTPSLFENKAQTKKCPCPGCQKRSITEHNGVRCLLRDWGSRDPITGEKHRKIPFVSLIK